MRAFFTGGGPLDGQYREIGDTIRYQVFEVPGRLWEGPMPSTSEVPFISHFEVIVYELVGRLYSSEYIFRLVTKG
jgi:hypothetical protein